MGRFEDEIPVEHIQQVMLEASNYFNDAGQRERDADQRARLIADAHKEGWKLVARAISEGLGAIARAVENRR